LSCPEAGAFGLGRQRDYGRFIAGPADKLKRQRQYRHIESDGERNGFSSNSSLIGCIGRADSGFQKSGQ